MQTMFITYQIIRWKFWNCSLVTSHCERMNDAEDVNSMLEELREEYGDRLQNIQLTRYAGLRIEGVEAYA